MEVKQRRATSADGQVDLLDVTFQEDQGRIRKGNADANFSTRLRASSWQGGMRATTARLRRLPDMQRVDWIIKRNLRKESEAAGREDAQAQGDCKAPREGTGDLDWGNVAGA